MGLLDSQLWSGRLLSYCEVALLGLSLPGVAVGDPVLVTLCSVFPSLCVPSVSTGCLATSPVPGTVSLMRPACQAVRCSVWADDSLNAQSSICVAHSAVTAVAGGTYGYKTCLHAGSAACSFSGSPTGTTLLPVATVLLTKTYHPLHHMCCRQQVDLLERLP
jgi:hypothetical protein